VLLVGFAEEEEEVVCATVGAAACVLLVQPSRLHLRPQQLLSPSEDCAPSQERAEAAPGRLVLLSGGACEFGADLKAALLEAGLQPAVYGALRAAPHRALTLRAVAERLLAAHVCYHGLLRPVRTHPTSWSPSASSLRVVLNARVSAYDPELHEQAAEAPSGAVVVLDGLLSPALSVALLEALTEPGWREDTPAPPQTRWERETRDTAVSAPTWGLTPDALRSLQGENAPSCVVELQSRLALLYPDYQVCHLPGDAMVPPDAEEGVSAAVAPLVGNAAVHGDAFSWHRDAQPALLHPESPWCERYGLFENGAEGKPLLVSAVVYMNQEWPESFDAETLFLDAESGAGMLVRPRQGRVVLMHQDLLHRLSAPSVHAQRPRFSLVWKLAMMPRPGAKGLHREGWGEPLRL